MGGGAAGNHARGGRSQSEKDVSRQCCARLPADLESKFSLNLFGVLAHLGSEPFASQKSPIQTDRKTRSQNLDSMPVRESLYHFELPKSFTTAELGPIQNLRAPDVRCV